MIIYLFVCYFVKYNLHFTSKYHSISCKVDYSTWHTSVREITIPRARSYNIYIPLYSLSTPSTLRTPAPHERGFLWKFKKMKFKAFWGLLMDIDDSTMREAQIKKR